MAVHVLYFEQLRRTIQAGGGHNTTLFLRVCDRHRHRDVVARWRRDAIREWGEEQGDVATGQPRVGAGNWELKLEVTQMRLTDLVKDQVSLKHEMVHVNPWKHLFWNFAPSLGRLNSLFQMRPTAGPGLQQLARQGHRRRQGALPATRCFQLPRRDLILGD
uniref:Uncharacterized protein n=1 Tax=Oryza meridionalis TaxID=40149 RepID=A0A0E0CYF9_9ORYZ